MPPARRNPEQGSLAGAAGDRVRAIIEAAEASAAEIRAEAEAESERIRARAEERASALRREARSDVHTLLGSIRNAVDRLRTDLEQLESRLGDPEAEAQAEPEPAGATPPAATPPAATPPVATPPVATPPDEPDVDLFEDAAVDLDESTAGDQAAAKAADPDLEGARLVALNMALEGKSRPEVDRYLRENYDLADREGLLDEVYALVGS